MNDFSEFTEDGFVALLRELKRAQYRFARYGERNSDRHVLWRHDVDMSLHRAARLAEIEAEEGVIATYFINPRSTFYNMFEPECEALLSRILSFGHDIGLHFDANAYLMTHWTEEALDLAVRRELSLLRTVLQASIQTVSWHNPDTSNLLDFQSEEIGGLRNTYGLRFKRDYTYCSDSNGYWRFQPMSDVIREGKERLHLLTHPEWWTPDPMSPSDRVARAINGRARKIRFDYDTLLDRGGRLNIAD